MADVITRLKIESGEYDSKIKRAVSGLQNMEQECRRVDGTLAILEKDQKQYVQSLGQMQTVSNTVRGKIGELTSAYVELSSQYKRLTEEEKKGDFGKALSSSLEQIKQRINDSKKELSDIQKELNATGNESNSTGSILDQLSQKFTINFDAVKLFNTALNAADGAMQVAKDAFFASEATVDEWGRTVEASRGLYEGFLTALNNGDISGYLSRMDQIVEAARAAYNEMDRLGTMKTIQGPAMSAQQAENDRMRQMIMTGRYIAPIDGRRAAPGMVNGQRLTAEQIRAIERNLQGSMQKIVTLVGNEVKQTSKAIDARYSLMAKENGMTMKEFRQGTSSMAEYDKRMEGYQKYEQWRKDNSFTDAWGNRVVRPGNPYQEYKKWGVFRVDKMGEGSYNDLVNLIRQRDQQAAQAYGMQSQAYRSINRAEGTTYRDIMNGDTGRTGGGTGGSTSGKSGSTPADDIAKAEANYAATMNMAQRDLMENVITQKKYDETIFKGQQDLANAYNKAYEATGDEKYLKAYQETASHVTEMQGVIDSNIAAQKESEKAARELESKQKALADAIGNRSKAVGENSLKSYYQANDKVVAAGGQTDGALIPVEFTATQDNIAAVISELKEGVASSDIGTETFNKLTEQMSDATALGGIISEMVKQGIDTAEFSDAIGEMWQKLGEGDIPDATIEGFLAKVNEKIKDKGGIQLEMNANTGEVTEKKKNDNGTLKEMQQMVSGLSQVASGLQSMGIVLPSEVTKVISVMQGAMAVTQGVSTIISLFGSTSLASNTAMTTANTSQLTFNTLAMASLESALWANSASRFLFFSSGGVVPKFAEGGLIGKAADGMLIPGNSYSGDRLRIPVDGGRGVIGVNSGELILNMSSQDNLAATIKSAESLVGTIRDESMSLGLSQVGVLADALDNEGGGAISSTPYVTGEQIFLGLNNYLKGAGLGSLVTSQG